MTWLSLAYGSQDFLWPLLAQALLAVGAVHHDLERMVIGPLGASDWMF